VTDLRRYRQSSRGDIAFRTDLALERLDAVHHHMKMNARTAIGVMVT
jgi:hypothetical protein